MVRAIFEFVRVFTWAVWAVIGLVFWVPFFLRMVAFFTGSILVSVGGHNDMSVALVGLNKAVRFYPDGFIIIQTSISNLIKGNVDEKISWDSKNYFWMPLLEHFIFAGLFWGSTLYFIFTVFYK